MELSEQEKAEIVDMVAEDCDDDTELMREIAQRIINEADAIQKFNE